MSSIADRLAVASLVFLLLAPTTYAQSGKAELFGTVRDPSDLPVPQAQVQAQELATGIGFPTKTNDRGEYHLLGLPAGSYALIVSKPGFRDYRQIGIQLRIGDQSSQDVSLAVGEASQEVD